MIDSGYRDIDKNNNGRMIFSRRGFARIAEEAS